MAAPNLRNPTSVVGKSEGYAVTTTLTATLSNPANSNKCLKVNSVYCANIDGTVACDLDLTLFNGTTDRYFAKTISIPADGTQVMIGRDSFVYLEEGESLRAMASANGDLELIVSYEEIS